MHKQKPSDSPDARGNFTTDKATSQTSPEQGDSLNVEEYPDEGKAGENGQGHEQEVDDDGPSLVLEVGTLEEGLEKASTALELPIKELKSRILDKELREVNGEIEESLRIEFSRKQVAGLSQIHIADDKCSATIKILYPRKPDGSKTTYPYILTLIRKAKITHGLNLQAVKEAIEQLHNKYDILENVEIARGTPALDEKPLILQSVFLDEQEISYKSLHEISLGELFSFESCDMISELVFPVCIVQKGESLVVTTTSESGPGEKGIDIFGEEILSKKWDRLFEAGEHVKVERAKDNLLIYSAELSGYLELTEGTLRIQNPVWISPDRVDAYFVKLPFSSQLKNGLNSSDITDQLKAAGVIEGIIASKTNTLPDKINRSHGEFYEIKVASGIPARKGEDARLEFFFKKEQQPGRLLESGAVDYREIEKIVTVKKKQLIATKRLPQDGIPGRTVKGEMIEAQQGSDINFNALDNVRVVSGEGKFLYYSTIDGSVEVVKDISICVKPVCTIEKDLDFSTGNVVFNGDVIVKGSVTSGFRIVAKGNIYIEGTVNQNVNLEAGGNINVDKGIIGLAGVRETLIKAKGNVTANYIQGARVEAGGDVMVADYIFNSYIQANGKVFFPSNLAIREVKRSIVGGDIFAINGVEANAIGSEMSAKTQITVGITSDFKERLEKFKAALEFCDNEYAKVSKTLRISVFDAQSIKALLNTLPPMDRRIFVDALKRLREIINLRNQLETKQQKLLEKADKLAGQVEIVVKKELYPRVNIQIGKLKLRTSNTLTNLKLKIANDGKTIEHISL